MNLETTRVPIHTVDSGQSSACSDFLAVEEPLQLCLNGFPLAITMRTPGCDLDLAAGFLFAEGIIDDIGQILSMRSDFDEERNEQNVGAGARLTIRLRPDVVLDPQSVRRNFYTSSSCGICGKVAMGAIDVRPCRPLPESSPQFHADVIYRLPQLLRSEQGAFEQTGGLHAAGLFSPDGKLLGLREDVGRHNAVDKLIGFALREGKVPLSNSLILVSGRAGFELVQKSVRAAIPFLAAVGAPSSSAVELARRFGMTVIGFLRGARFNVYSGGWRIA